MRLCVSLLAVAALAFAAETANPCKRQPFRGRCPSVNGEPPKRSQFVLRYYMRNGECVSYPFGHCANDETEPKLYRYKEECEDACISNAPANLGPAKVFEETYATPKASEQEVVAVANGVKNEVQEEPFSTVVSMIDAADPSTAPTPSTTLAAKTSVVTTTATASTEAPTTTTTSEATTTEVVTEEVKKTSPETTSTSTTTTTTPATTTTTTTSSTTTTTVPTTTTTKESMTSSTAPSTTTRAQAKVDAQATKSASGASATTTNSPRTECERRRAHASSSSIRGAFVPTCTSTGDFEKVQCEPSREQCFCVDSRGIELPNSRTRNGQRPDCYSIQTAQRSSGKECVGGVSRGPCHSTFSRWFYDESSQSCKQFEYSGCGGNGNNYDSKEACESRCAPPPMGLPKCEFGEPLKTKIGVPVNCAKTDCPSGYKCSVVQQSSVCCRESNKDLGLQTSDNRCHLPKERGPCDKYELRFYYNPDLHECKYFFWGGCDGNANNFEKADDCEVSCGIRKASAGTGSAPSEPATTARSHPNIRTTQGIRITPNMLSSDSGSDGSTTFATNPPTTTTRAVPTTTTRQTTTQTSTTTPRTRPVTTTTSQPPRSRTTTPAAESEEEDSSESAEPVIVAVPNQVLLGGSDATSDSANRCHHPRDSGNCRGQFVRWHFDTERKVCDVFTYTGCQGNGNNFASREECLAICQKPASTAAPLPDFNNICNNDVDAGECNGVFQRFAFDTEAGSCREFTYGGCGGNGNNFATMAECRQRCLKTTPSESVGNACESDIDIGECEGVFHRFAFDKTFNDCRQFTYGGCGGNGNNFATMQECRNNCVNRVCPEPPACDVSRCQLVNDRAGCPFCSCPPVKQPLPPGTSQCPSVADCEEPCIKISNRKGCEECVCPSSTSRLSPPPTPELPSTVSVAASTRGARPPSHHVVQPPAPISVGPPAHSVAAPGPVQHAVPTFESTRSEPLELSRPTKPSPIPTRTSLPNLPSILSSQLEEKCMQPVEPGPCKNFADRWYFNSEDGTCHPFKYGGCAGNRNHFFTQKECEVHCERFLRITDSDENFDGDVDTEFEEPTEPPRRVDGTRRSFAAGVTTRTAASSESYPPPNPPFRAEIRSDYEHRAAGSKLLQAPQPVQIEHKDNGIGRQPESVNIHAAAGTPTPATVPSTVRTSPTTRSIPTTTATSTSQKTTTRPTQPTPSGFEPKFDGRIACAMPPDAGTCFDYVPRWFFNSQTGQCEQFSFGSCGGNQNNFPDRNTCERKCMPHHVILSQVPDRCAQEKETGHGKGYNVKWYFNMKNLRCEQFVFEGLGGNANQFETLNECERLCTPSSAGIRQQPETTTQNKIIIDSLEEDDDENYSDDLVQTNSDVPPLPTIQPASVGNVEQRVELPPLVVETVATTTEKQILGPEPPANVEAALPPAAEPRPPAVNAAKTITAEDIRKSKTYKTESIVGRENFPTANDGQPIVGTSPKEEVNYQTGEVNPKASGIRNFPVGAEKINIDLADRVFEKKELNRMPACANGRQEMRYADGRPVMCLPGKNQCPDNSACYFNGLDFFCCPNEEDPYDKHVFGGYDGEETKQGYKVFGPLRIRRLMDEVPLRVRRQAQSVFSIDSVVAPLRFDAEKPHSVSRALRMKPKPEPRHNVNSLCIQQPIRGSCQEAHLRYYYDQGSDSCRLFEYTGCDGNANNFGSLDDCQRLCVLDVQRIGSAKVTTTTSAPEKVTPGQCPEGRAPLGGSSPVLCGNTTDSIGCPSSYYCRRGPPDVCCPGADPLIEQPEEIVTEERRGIVKNESNLPRGFNRKVFLSTPKHMCPDAADPLMLENGQPLSCGSGFDGVQMCPKGYYCAMDAERNSRLCCPMFGDAQRIASEEIFAHRISVAETTTTLAPSQFEAEDAEEEEDEEETEQEGSLAHLRMKADPNAKKEKLEQLALTSPQAADLAAEGSVAIDLGASEQPSEEPTTTTSKPVVDRSTCQIKPSEGRVCRDDEQPTRTNLQYFYSPRDRRCKLFFFRGCGGNENRFERKVDCEALCISG